MPAQIDDRNNAAIRDCLLAMLDLGPRTIVLDMSATTSCDRAAVRMIMRIQERARQHGTEVRAAAVTPGVSARFVRVSPRRVLSIYPDLESARGQPRQDAAMPGPDGHTQPPVTAGSSIPYDDGVFRVGVAGAPPQLTMAGEIDDSAYPGLLRVLEATAAGQHEIHVHLDQVEYCDLAGLRAIVRLFGPDEAGDASRRRVVLHGLPCHLVSLLRILGWDMIAGLEIAQDAAGPVSGDQVTSAGTPAAEEDG
jgi:anti-anti-sigma regulatory factor